MVEREKRKVVCMHSKGMNVLHCRGLFIGCDDRKNNNKKARNYPLQYPSKEIIQRKTTKEEEHEELFTPLKSPRKSPSFHCHANAMKDLTKHFADNFNLWSLQEYRSRKHINGKEKFKLANDVEIFILNNGEEKETIDNKSPIVIEANIQEFKVGTVLY